MTFLRFFLQPGIAQRVFGFADRNNLPAEAEHGTVFDDAEFFEIGTTARTAAAGACTEIDRKEVLDSRQVEDADPDSSSHRRENTLCLSAKTC